MSQLVSVIITTYNSSNFVIETLESVKAQTYESIELVVSDDGSQDDTVLIAKKWLQKNAQRFFRTDVITVPINTGVSANCNRGIAAAQSDWIKFIAGDDILLPNCIEDNIEFVVKHKEAKVVFSQVELYKNTFSESRFIATVPSSFPSNIMHPSFTATDQFKRLLISDRINFTPSYFFAKQAVLSVGGYDELNKLVEDYPMWLKLTLAEYRLFFFEKPTVGYRQHDKAMNNKIASVLIKPSVFASYSFRKSFVHPYLPWDLKWDERVTMSIAYFFERLKLNKDVPFLRMTFRLLTVYFNPFKYLSFIKKKCGQVDPVYYSK